MGFLDKLFANSKYLNKKEDRPPIPKDWNKFIYEVCDKDLDELSGIRRAAALCFWYDAELQNGGHSGFFDCQPEIDPEELISAINLIGSKEIADNFRKALDERKRYGDDDDDDDEDDGYETVDNAYYDFVPSLCDFLMRFVENNKEEIFRGIL